jgi:hypothetical protein
MANFQKIVRNKGVVWRVRLTKNNKFYTSTFPTKKLAQDWVTKLEHEAMIEEHFPERAP